MENGLISVDEWSQGSQAYFLTHLHSDHTKGLSPQWNRGPLFCSPLSAALFPAKFPGFNLSLVTALQPGSPHPLSLRSPSRPSPINLLVTPIDSNHCPGAVMYLFHGEFGCMLYTGDFRWEMSTERGQAAKRVLLDALRGEQVDHLYLDNTYCNPSFAFPPRQVAAQQVVDIIASHPGHDIVIGVDTLGKEDLLVHISQALKTKVWVWPERLQIMRLLGIDNIFTTKTHLTRVRAVPRYSLTIRTLEALNTISPTIGIMPSGLPWALKPLDENGDSSNSTLSICHRSTGKIHANESELNEKSHSPKMLHQYIYTVPYSDHSCFSELHDFVKLVSPSKISGIVSSSFCYINPRHYFSFFQKDNWPMSRPLKKSTSNQAAEKAIVKGKAHVDRTIDCYRTRRSRVSILRRERHGVKVAETE